MELRRVSSPFDVAVSVEGHPLYDLVLTVSGLPDPSTLRAYTTYVAWLAPPSLSTKKKLGEVRNGVDELGRVDLENFIIMI